jgi:hypothetical protein
MVSAASPLAGDDGLGTPSGAPPGRRPGLPPTRRPGLPPTRRPSPPKRTCPDASGPTAVTLSKADSPAHHCHPEQSEGSRPRLLALSP